MGGKPYCTGIIFLKEINFLLFMTIITDHIILIFIFFRIKDCSES